jgi:hypothetical protein
MRLFFWRDKSRHQWCRCDDCVRIFGWPPVTPSEILPMPKPPTYEHWYKAAMAIKLAEEKEGSQ